MRRKRAIVLAVVFLVLFSLFWSMQQVGRLPGARGQPTIGLIHLEGPFVVGGAPGGLLGGATDSDAIVRQLEAALDDPSVRAVVIRINSPGSSAAAAHEVAEAVNRLKARVPVVASMGDVAASGGYWVASQASAIVANPATMTGSIGVIMQLVNLEDLYGKLGIEHEVIKSGPHKDIGTDTRPITDRERQLMQEMIDDIFDQFVAAVSTGRGMAREKLLPLADGRVFTGRQAQEQGLVDYLGDLEHAIQLAARRAGLGQWMVRVLTPRPTLMQLLGISGAGRLLPGLDLTSQLWWGRQLARWRTPK